MLRPACGSLFALLLMQSSAFGQVLVSCDGPQSVEVTVWRGGLANVNRLSSRDRLCLEDLERRSIPIEEQLVPFEWGTPGLEEITTLMLAAPQLSGLLEQAAEEPGGVPAVISSGPDRDYPEALLAGATRTVVIGPVTDEIPQFILHLMIFEAGPSHLEVGIQSERGQPILLSWTRTPNDPEWSPAG